MGNPIKICSRPPSPANGLVYVIATSRKGWMLKMNCSCDVERIAAVAENMTEEWQL